VTHNKQPYLQQYSSINALCRSLLNPLAGQTTNRCKDLNHGFIFHRVLSKQLFAGDVCLHTHDCLWMLNRAGRSVCVALSLGPHGVPPGARLPPNQVSAHMHKHKHVTTDNGAQQDALSPGLAAAIVQASYIVIVYTFSLVSSRGRSLCFSLVGDNTWTCSYDSLQMIDMCNEYHGCSAVKPCMTMASYDRPRQMGPVQLGHFCSFPFLILTTHRCRTAVSVSVSISLRT